MAQLAKYPDTNSWPQVLHSHHHSVLVCNSKSTVAKVNTLISTKTCYSVAALHSDYKYEYLYVCQVAVDIELTLCHFAMASVAIKFVILLFKVSVLPYGALQEKTMSVDVSVKKDKQKHHASSQQHRAILTNSSMVEINGINLLWCHRTSPLDQPTHMKLIFCVLKTATRQKGRIQKVTVYLYNANKEHPQSRQKLTNSNYCSNCCRHCCCSGIAAAVWK
jgi:hypothetical protein